MKTQLVFLFSLLLLVRPASAQVSSGALRGPWWAFSLADRMQFQFNSDLEKLLNNDERRLYSACVDAAIKNLDIHDEEDYRVIWIEAPSKCLTDIKVKTVKILPGTPSVSVIKSAKSAEEETKNGMTIPKGWSPLEFNGMRYYFAPLSEHKKTGIPFHKFILINDIGG